MKDKVLVVVGYYGGYGGSFFSNVLRKSLNKDSLNIDSINNRNEYFFKTEVLGDERYSLDAVMKAYDQGFNSMLNVTFIDSTNERMHWVKTLKSIYNECYSEDRLTFIENLKKYYKKKLNLNQRFNVTNMHYSRPYEGFSIHEVYENTVFFLLKADSFKHHLMFDLLLDIKHNNFQYPEFIERSLDTLSTSNFEYFNQPFDNCYDLDAGKMFFEYEKNNVDEVEKKVIEALDFKISLDKPKILDYCKSNIKIMNEFLSIDSEKSSFLQVIQAARKKLKSLL